MMTVLHVAHDPFARGAYHREPSRDSCAWCGRIRGTFRYVWESDDRGCRRPDLSWSARAFCNLECLRTYHGIGR